MSSYLSASWIYPVSSAPLKNGVIALSDDGTVTGIFTAAAAAQQGLTAIQHHEGVLIPGLINTHCHLELSHLAGRIPEHTGLQGFVQQVMQQRETAAPAIEDAMAAADAAMHEQGIVAVGDISNRPISRSVKLKSEIYYHTFVEAMGFNPAKAGEIIRAAEVTRAAFSPLRATIVPHAPYSVSEALFSAISEVSGAEDESVSIHNQETEAENMFFESKTGHFLDLYRFLGLDISFFKAMGKTSLQSYLPLLPVKPRTLLVHNTFTSKEDLAFAKAAHAHLYWCLCPNANLYIEGRLPDIALLKNAELNITLGTDSLASNHQLSILSEMQVLQETGLATFEELLLWATLNGAAFLGIAGQYGSIEVGKKPGINLIEGLQEGKINAATRIRRLF